MTQALQKSSIFPPKLIKSHVRDKAWFNDDRKPAYDYKLSVETESAPVGVG